MLNDLNEALDDVGVVLESTLVKSVCHHEKHVLDDGYVEEWEKRVGHVLVRA